MGGVRLLGIERGAHVRHLAFGSVWPRCPPRREYFSGYKISRLSDLSVAHARHSAGLLGDDPGARSRVEAAPARQRMSRPWPGDG